MNDYDRSDASSRSAGRRGATRAFSLVEVVVALGIVTLSLVTMVGMIPVGLQSMREAVDATTKAQITQWIAAQVMMTPFEKIPSALSGKIYYFDQEGFAQATPGTTTRFQVALSTRSMEYPGAAGGTMDDSAMNLLLHMTFYGRGANAVAADVALAVPNQNGKSGTTAPTSN